MAKRKARGICPYCGRNKNLSREHVIPRTFFIAMDRYMVTVEICEQCNREMSTNIRDLRNWIVMSVESVNHPDWETHLRKIFDTNEATRHWIAKTMDEAEEADFVTPEGVVTGSVLLTKDFNKEPARLALARVVRGLYLVTMETALPVDCVVSVIEVPAQTARGFIQTMMGHRHGRVESRGDDIVSWVPYLETESGDSKDSMWLIIFFDASALLEALVDLERFWKPTG